MVRFERTDTRSSTRLRRVDEARGLLDAAGDVQCTSCHDAHRDPRQSGADVPPFWRGLDFDAVCEACHDAGLYDVGHDDEHDLPGGCGSCHVGHGVAGEALLPDNGQDACLSCHRDALSRVGAQLEGRLGRAARISSMGPILDLPYTHPTATDAKVDFERRAGRLGGRASASGADCADCHPVHGISADVSRDGAFERDRPQREGEVVPMLVEVCYGCHSRDVALPPGSTDKREEFGVEARSAHPIERPGSGRAAATLKAPWAAGDLMTCADCHGPSADAAVRGPHGSRNEWILTGAYRAESGSEDGEGTYELCYECHDRASVIDGTWARGHRGHVVEARISCYACHDSHGSLDAVGLVRFSKDARYAAAEPSTSGRLEYDADTGGCFLTCHDVDHDPLRYP